LATIGGKHTEHIDPGTKLTVALIPVGYDRVFVLTEVQEGGTAQATITIPEGTRLGHVQAWADSVPIPTP